MRRYLVLSKISVYKYLKIKLLVLILSVCACAYFVISPEILQYLKITFKTSGKNTPGNINMLPVFKQNPKEKSFGTKGLLLVTAFSTDHWVEAL